MSRREHTREDTPYPDTPDDTPDDAPRGSGPGRVSRTDRHRERVEVAGLRADAAEQTARGRQIELESTMGAREASLKFDRDRFDSHVGRNANAAEHTARGKMANLERKSKKYETQQAKSNARHAAEMGRLERRKQDGMPALGDVSGTEWTVLAAATGAAAWLFFF